MHTLPSSKLRSLGIDVPRVLYGGASASRLYAYRVVNRAAAASPGCELWCSVDIGSRLVA